MNSSIWRPLAIAGFLCAAAPLVAHAQTAEENAPDLNTPAAETATPSRSRPGTVTFDEATVRAYIDSIPMPQRTSSLKNRYFGGFGKADPASDKGYAILKEALAREPLGTHRWFVLQQLTAFAAFRVPGIVPGEGFESYKAIMAQALQIPPESKEFNDVVIASINDFISTIGDRMKDPALRDSGETSETLVAAWKAYIHVLPQGITPSSRKPQWERALELTGAHTAMTAQTEATLADPKIPRTYALLRATASVLALSAPQRALVLLQEAKPIVPRGDVNETGRLYEAILDVLLPKSGELTPAAAKSALAEQLELKQKIKFGNDRLVGLLILNGDIAEANRILEELTKPEAVEWEVTRTAELLLGRDTRTQRIYTRFSADRREQNIEKGLVLINSYLRSPRERSPDYELGVRHIAGQRLIDMGKLEEAKAMLTYVVPEKPLRGNAPGELRSVQRLAAEVDKKIQQAAPAH